MDFIESIQSEGVELARKAMGEGTEHKTPLLVEVDRERKSPELLDELDIEIPVLGPSLYRDYKNLSELDVGSLNHEGIEYKTYTEDELKAIVFKELTTGEITHTTYLDSAGVGDYRSVIGWFARNIMKDLRLFSGY